MMMLLRETERPALAKLPYALPSRITAISAQITPAARNTALPFG